MHRLDDEPHYLHEAFCINNLDLPFPNYDVIYVFPMTCKLGLHARTSSHHPYEPISLGGASSSTNKFA